jgi:hypothetical protein
VCMYNRGFQLDDTGPHPFPKKQSLFCIFDVGTCINKQYLIRLPSDSQNGGHS